jgi:hypothetical protein
MTNTLPRIIRSGYYCEKVIFVDGLFGCGKTMLSPIIAAFPRVELLSYIYELEYFCTLHYLGKISLDVAGQMARVLTDLKLYNSMMSRDVNFRPSDLSSVFKDHNPERYFLRMFAPGDEHVPEKIKLEKPILNIATHNLLAYSQAIFEGLGDRAFFVEVVRHPIYMLKQIYLNMGNLIGEPRDFTLYVETKHGVCPYYFVPFAEEFFSTNSPKEKAILYIEKIGGLTNLTRLQYQKNVITIPFESFVLSPDKWIEALSKALNLQITDSVFKSMRNQGVPRVKTVQGVDLEIYRRCGWRPEEKTLTEKEEINIRYQEFVSDISIEYKSRLDKLISDYESCFWNP